VALTAAATALALGGGTTWLALREAPEHVQPTDEFANVLLHVHGLGVDPADGALYAASHTGLFRLPEDPSGKAERVADRWQDTMAFTVVGPSRFLASGHPDLREDRPDILGLIESRDAGRTWEPLSREGVSDFHALQPAGDLLYGYDSTAGRLLVTADQETWEPRSTLVMTALATDPADTDTLLAVTADGALRRSEDGGRSFTPLPGSPVLDTLAWPNPGEVYGTAPDGTVLTSPDGGTTWQSRGTLDGPATALTAEDSATVHVATDTGIYTSTDGGRTFEARYPTTLGR
jgi:hypothetical protein